MKYSLMLNSDFLIRCSNLNFYLLLAGDNATMYQLNFQDPATTSMEGIYLFNLHLLFVIISIVVLVGWLLSIILKNFIELLLLAVFNLNFATFSTYLTFTRRVALILKNFTFKLRGWDVEKFESIDPTDNFGYNTRSYSYSRQAYANQSDCGMMMHMTSMTSAKSTSLGGLLNGIISISSNMISENPITFGVVGVALGGYYIYRYFKNKSIDPKDPSDSPLLLKDSTNSLDSPLLLKDSTNSLDSPLLKNSTDSSLNNTELLFTKNLEEITDEITSIASGSSSSLLHNSLLENNLVTESISNLVVNHNHYSAVLGYSATEIPIIYSPIIVYVALKNLSIIKHAYPSIFVSPEHKNLLENLLKAKMISYAAANAAAKEPLIYYHEGYGSTNLCNLCLPPDTFSPTGVPSASVPRVLLSVPEEMLTSLHNESSIAVYNLKNIHNLKISLIYWCVGLPKVNANPSTYTFLSYIMDNDFDMINQTLTANIVAIPLSVVDTWLLTLQARQDIHPEHINEEMYRWSMNTTLAIKGYNLLTKALEGSAEAGEFEDLDIAINDLAVSKKIFARAIAEFKNNASGESFHAIQEQKRFISFCLKTRNEYLLNFFLTNFYERPNQVIMQQRILPYFEGDRTGRNLLIRYMYGETDATVSFPLNFDLFHDEDGRS